MYWEDKKEMTFIVPDDIQDLVFKIEGTQLPLDHAHALSTSIRTEIPWIDSQPDTGIHLIHGAESGNGWLRPEDERSELLILSRRAKLTLRVAKAHIDESMALCSKELNIDGYEIIVGAAKTKMLSPLPTLFSRHVITGETEDENQFMHRIIDELKTMNIHAPKLLCGKLHSFRTPDGRVYVRSLMLADLEIRDSIYIQQHGIGRGRLMGCGLFLPHKSIDALNKDSA